MSKRTSSKYKISRRLGVNLWGRDKDPYERRNYAPGQHGLLAGRRVRSDFGKQLFAKQQLKGYYGNISEKQFRKIFKEASKQRGDAGENFLALLERRLDITIYRLNFVPTVFAARQFVNHKHILVNGKTVNVPSYRLKEGDVIEIKDASKQLPMVIEATEAHEREIPSYLEADLKNRKGKYLRVPASEEIPYPVQMEVNLVIEFYSR